MMPALVAGLLGLLPWLFGGLGLGCIGFFGYRIGLPTVRILQLRAEVNLLRVQLETAQEQLKTAQEREDRCVARLEAVTVKLEESDQRVRTLVAAIDIKHKLDSLADQLQPVTVKGAKHA